MSKSKHISTHRYPQRPESYYEKKKGHCRWCGQEIIENGKINNRKKWHKECVHLYNMIYDSGYAKTQVWKKSDGMCESCRRPFTYHNPMELDHRKPLWENRLGLDELWYWLEGNLQLLCRECHKRKSKQDTQRWRDAQRIIDVSNSEKHENTDNDQLPKQHENHAGTD